MVERIYASENNPFPNSSLPILYYKNTLKDVLDDSYSASDVVELFANNGWTNGWKNGIHKHHHFHANTHEVLACTEGDATVQLGGPDGDVFSFRKGDVLLLPAGVAHKKAESSADFEVVGAYPEGMEPDMQKGDAGDYEAVRKQAASIEIPATDPVTGAPGALQENWQ